MNELERLEVKKASGFVLGSRSELWSISHFNEVLQMAQNFAKSTISIVPESIRGKTQDIAMILLIGKEAGLSPMLALRTVSVIKGKPEINGEGTLALINLNFKGAGCRCENVVTKNGVHGVKVFMKRDVNNPNSTEHTEIFTMDDAKRAGLLEGRNTPWAKYPKIMMKWRAVKNCARFVFPDIGAGYYSEDELGYITPEKVDQQNTFETPMEIEDKREAPKKVEATVKKNRISNVELKKLEEIEKRQDVKNNVIHDILLNLKSKTEKLTDIQKLKAFKAVLKGRKLKELMSLELPELEEIKANSELNHQ